jgi:hypothetical protein
LSKSKDKDSRVERYAPNCRGLSVGANFGRDFACRLRAKRLDDFEVPAPRAAGRPNDGLVLEPVN